MTRVRHGIRAEHSGKSVAAAGFRADDIAVRPERFAQCGDLNLEVLFRHHDTPPHAADELLFSDEQAVRLQEASQPEQFEPAERRARWPVIEVRSVRPGDEALLQDFGSYEP